MQFNRGGAAANFYCILYGYRSQGQQLKKGATLLWLHAENTANKGEQVGQEVGQLTRADVEVRVWARRGQMGRGWQ